MSLVASPEPIAPVAAPAVEPAVAAVPPVAAVVDPPAAVAPVKPDGLPDAYWDAAAGLKVDAVTARLTELETAEAARAADVPADGKYTLSVPDTILDLEGKPVTINAEDPLAKGLVAYAAEKKLPASVVNDLVALYTQAELAAAKDMQAAQAAELAKLGTGATARIAAYTATLKAHGGPTAQALIDSIGSADAVLAVEALLKGVAGPAAIVPPVQEPPADPLAGLHGADLLAAARARKA